MIRHDSMGAIATMLLLNLSPTGQAVAAQDCSFGNDDMDEIQRIRSCMQRYGTTGWNNPNGLTMLHRAARYSTNSAVISVILDTGFTPNARDDNGWTPHHYAVDFNDNLVVSSVLLDAGADPNVRNNDGDTPLQIAVRQATVVETGRRLVSMLLDAGADANTRDNDGDTPLHVAVLDAAIGEGGRQLVSVLLDAGADSNLKDADGDVPLQAAILFEDLALASFLLDAGADPNARDGDGETLLHRAVSSGDRRLVSVLLDAGADPAAITYDEEANTPLHLAAVGDDPTLVSVLLNAGADPMARGADGRTPLHSAVYGSDSRAVALALMVARAATELTDLHIAVLKGDQGTWATALQVDSVLDAPDSYGWTALHFAVFAERWADQPAILEDLVTAGADPEARDLNGMTPLDLLSQYGGKASVAVLLGARADARPDGEPTGGFVEGVPTVERSTGVVDLNVGDVFLDCTGCPRMVVVPPGSYLMGSSAREEDRDDKEGPQHSVRISTPFAVGVHEVTFGEWDICALAGGCADLWASDEGWGRGSRPVINVSWEDAKGYVNWLSELTGSQYRLLTEAEWEYVARAGTQSSRYWGESAFELCQHANADDNEIACSDGHENTAPVGSFRANHFGLYDVIGNVWEWTEDCWNASYTGAPHDGSAWETGNCSLRVLRGGSWISGPDNHRSAVRIWNSTDRAFRDAGFRVASTIN